MKGEILFEKMTGISEAYVTEAALVPALGADPAPRRESRFAALSNALNSGWCAACICVIAAIAAVVGMATWGRMGEPVGPVGPGYQPPAQGNFSFSVSDFMAAPPSPGGGLLLETSVKNEGAPFTFEGSSMGFAPSAVLIHAESGYRIEGYVEMTADVCEVTVNTGDVGTCVQEFFIPADAPMGEYDLVLAYGDAQQAFHSFLTILNEENTPSAPETNEPAPPVTDASGPFTFGYEPYGGDPLAGSYFRLETSVKNDGAPFTFEGSSMGFAPDAVLIHEETGYRIEGYLSLTTDICEVTVNTGDVGTGFQEFFIPAGAPAGSYKLVLSYGGRSTVFEDAVTIADAEG